jgi:hypothetical protein
MRLQDQYLTFVRWSEEDQAYIGYCPDLFPAGGVCHGKSPVEAFGLLCEIVEDSVLTATNKGLSLPPPSARPMRELDIVT